MKLISVLATPVTTSVTKIAASVVAGARSLAAFVRAIGTLSTLMFTGSLLIIAFVLPVSAEPASATGGGARAADAGAKPDDRGKPWVVSDCSKDPEHFEKMMSDLNVKVQCIAASDFETCAKIRNMSHRSAAARHAAVVAAELHVSSDVGALLPNNMTIARLAGNQTVKVVTKLAAAGEVGAEAAAERALLMNLIASQGMRALTLELASGGAYGAIAVTTFAFNSNPTGCDEPADFFFDHERGSCRPLLQFTPKIISFLAKTPEDRMAALTTTPQLCEVMTKLWEAQRLPKLTHASCDGAGAGVTASDGDSHLKFHANGRHLTSFESNAEKAAPPYDFSALSFNDQGVADSVCFNKTTSKAPQCDFKMKVTGFSAEGIARFDDYKVDAHTFDGMPYTKLARVNAAQSAINSARTYYSDLSEAFACCTPDEGVSPGPERCKAFGINKAAPSLPRSSNSLQGDH